jgi:hypothetical protein
MYNKPKKNKKKSVSYENSSGLPSTRKVQFSSLQGNKKIDKIGSIRKLMETTKEATTIK